MDSRAPETGTTPSHLTPVTLAGPDVTIIIVNYNGGRQLLDCLCALHQSRTDAHPGLEYEILVVDNASTDGSIGLVKDQFPGIQLLALKQNVGFGRANNEAAARAGGKYLAFLNPDTVVTAGWLEPLIAALNADSQIGLATARLLLQNRPTHINAAGNDVHFTGLTLCRGAGQPSCCLATAADVTAVSGAAFAMGRELFAQLGGFDDRYFMYFEDTDLSLRARLAGYRCLYIPESVVYHDYELHFGPHKTYYEERNRYLTLLKLFRLRTLILLLPALFLAEIVTWGYILLREPGRWPNKFRAYAYILRHRPAIRQARRRTQRSRRVTDRSLLSLSTHRLAFEQTGEGLVARLAGIFFEPAFFLLHRLLLATLRW